MKWKLELCASKCGWICFGDTGADFDISINGNKLLWFSSVVDSRLKYSNNLPFSDQVIIQTSKSYWMSNVALLFIFFRLIAPYIINLDVLDMNPVANTWLNIYQQTGDYYYQCRFNLNCYYVTSVNLPYRTSVYTILSINIFDLHVIFGGDVLLPIQNPRQNLHSRIRDPGNCEHRQMTLVVISESSVDTSYCVI